MDLRLSSAACVIAVRATGGMRDGVKGSKISTINDTTGTRLERVVFVSQTTS